MTNKQHRRQKKPAHKTITYDCIVVDRKYYQQLREVGQRYRGHPFSLNSVFNALRYESNSSAAKEIRQLAIESGGQTVTKTRVIFS